MSATFEAAWIPCKKVLLSEIRVAIFERLAAQLSRAGGFLQRRSVNR